jgi:hypothetical protein
MGKRQTTIGLLLPLLMFAAPPTLAKGLTFYNWVDDMPQAVGIESWFRDLAYPQEKLSVREGN